MIFKILKQRFQNHRQKTSEENKMNWNIIWIFWEIIQTLLIPLTYIIKIERNYSIYMIMLQKVWNVTRENSYIHTQRRTSRFLEKHLSRKNWLPWEIFNLWHCKMLTKNKRFFQGRMNQNLAFKFNEYHNNITNRTIMAD